MSRQTEIRIENARSHNLKGVSCRIPLGALTVVTGVSGSGKSTLAFDTLYAEGQRRYVTSLSTYARQFLERLPRPEVDAISSLPPAIAIEQRNRVTQARSTVGSATEILDHLRLLFARAGEIECPECGTPVRAGTAATLQDRIEARFAGQRILVAAPLEPALQLDPAGGSARLLREGFGRLLARDGSIVDLAETDAESQAEALQDALLLIDRLALAGPGDPPSALRLAEAIGVALERGAGALVVATPDGERATFTRGLVCDGCERRFPAPETGVFSFDSALGACEHCQGFGRTADIDWDRVVPDPGLSLEEHAIAPFATPMGRGLERDLRAACRRAGIPIDQPFASLSGAQRRWILEGDEDDWYGVRGFFDWLEGRKYKVQSRVLIARYRRYDPCDVCAGSRLRAEALAYRVGGRDIAALSRLSVAELSAWVDGLALSREGSARGERVVDALRTRVATVDAVGLGYMGLDRQVRTLSGGEAQRVQLAAALGGGLTASLYVLDEPSIGLHPTDMDRLLRVLHAIRDQGNTVVVVEHAAEVLAAADHVIDLGPGAGREGGELIAQGERAAIAAEPRSKTGALLRGEYAQPRSTARRKPRGAIEVIGASAHNLQSIDVSFPLGQLVVVTGVSGAGKSTLVQSVLVDGLLPAARRRGHPGACERIVGAESVGDVVVVDQTPAVRNPRSNPATVSKAFDAIRQRFAATREAKALGVSPGWFSFNVAGGRCETCEGAGEVVIDMQFLDDLKVPCDACGGTRYKRDVLGVRLAGRSIVDVLGATLDEAVELFAEDSKIRARLEPFLRVGLGYLTLGQPLSTLSGGEHQRVRLALALANPAPNTLYVLDEPTTGLHAADIAVLLACFDALVDAGASLIVVEHDLDVVARADWVIDLGPGGGPGGGRIVFSGPPEALVDADSSLTGQALRRRA